MGYRIEFKYCPKCKIKTILDWRERDSENRCEKCNKLTVTLSDRFDRSDESEVIKYWEEINGEKL